jgi:hypothetical protein
MKIILNSAETKFRNRNTKLEKFKPATLEIRHDCDSEHEFRIGLFITADPRDLEFEDGNVVRLKAAWSTPEEFAQWLGQLVSTAALLGLTDCND